MTALVRYPAERTSGEYLIGVVGSPDIASQLDRLLTGFMASIFTIFNSKPAPQSPPQGSPPTPQVNPVVGDYNLLSANINLDITDIFDIAGLPHIILNVRGENLLSADAVWMPDLTRRINSFPLFPGRGHLWRNFGAVLRRKKEGTTKRQ